MRLTLAAILLLGAMTCGCSKGGLPLVVNPPARAAPVASTPAGAVESFVRAYDARDLSLYRTLLTTDFAFAFVSWDLAGAPYQQSGWTRSDELVATANLFVNGTSSQPAASRIELTPATSILALPDDRPGKGVPYHRMVRVAITLRANIGSTVWYVTGEEAFYLVRGDSASVPPGSALPADSTRWYIERWEERELNGTGSALRRPVAPAQTTPNSKPTWGGLKAMFRVL